MKKTILFVDDEPNILSALKRMLRNLRNDMDLCFVSSGKEALEFLARNHTDVIISDMRMPGMDGATLLKEVQKKHPQVMRMILSGHADQGAIFETVGVAHQFLAKPTSADTLKEVLMRACRLQEIFKNDNMKMLVSRIGSLPSLPAVYSELEQKLKNPECSVEEVAATIEKDMAMSAKVLQLVNSAFFGLFKTVESPARAVNLLGIDTVKALVLNVGVFTELTRGSKSVRDIQALWDHSLKVAFFAKRIAESEGLGKECVGYTFIAGLLHDIGKLLFYVNNSSVGYQQVFELAGKRQLPCYQAEQNVMHTDHSEVGGYLLGLWGLPGPVVEAVAFHHNIDEYPVPTMCPAVLVHAADSISRQLHEAGEFAVPKPVLEYLEKADCDDRYNSWLEECRQLEKSQQD